MAIRKIKKLTVESFKFVLFSLSSIVVIYLLQKRNEKLGNQFVLIDSVAVDSKTCPLYPDKLKGAFDVDTDHIPTFDYLRTNIQNLSPGGFYKSNNCIPREKLAIIIPYRDRESNLLLLLKYLHPLLQNQDRYYRIILIEQFGNDIFNKGRIMNIAVKEALKIDDFTCFIFHDVDLIPENDKNIYECYNQPRHLSPAVDELRYNLMYFNLVGGVLALNLEQLNRTNGYSNLYWGWGAEDDDMSMRIIDCGYKITRPTNDIGRYKMILHDKRVRARNRFELLDYWKRYQTDGISSLDTFKYEIKSIKYEHLYTNITVDIGPAVKENIDKNKIINAKFKFF